MITLKELECIFDADAGQALQDWQELIRFPSVSADPEHHADCRACAQWLVGYLDRMGFNARLIETSGMPVVYAERAGRHDKPTVLYYGHYDVQPADPLDAWETPPFEPVLKDERLFGRGAQDNKGQMMFSLAAVKALVQRDQLDVPMKIVLEGEEESGGSGLAEILESMPDLFRADKLVVTDTCMATDGRPAVTVGLRGVVQIEATVRCADKDLHSGVHGGVAPNAAHAVARLVASLHHGDGRVAVEGFDDDVLAPTDEERRLAAEQGLDAEDYVRFVGVGPTKGDSAYSLTERIGFRPCLDVNGLAAGHAGAGFKTVIAGEATLKLSARLAAGQVPSRVLESLVRHLKAHTPSGARLMIERTGSGGPALRVSPDDPAILAAREILERVSGQRPVMRWEGASVPVVPALARATGATPVLVGFGLESDNIHAPNESFALDRFRMGFLAVASLLLDSPV